MKKFTLLVAVFLALGWYQASAQAYLDLILSPNENTTLQEIQVLAEAYFADKDKGRGSGYKQYKRWEYRMERLVNADGKLQNVAKRTYDVVKKLNSDNPPVPKSMMGNWTNLGPTSFTNGQSGYSGGLGRINVIAFHPTDANTLYVGGPSGGVWKSTDGGVSWAPMSDMLASIGVSGIAVDHNTPNTVYILTGDGDGADTYSIGIMKSTDGGATWGPTGLTYGVTQFKRGYKLLMHPTNPNIQFAVTRDGILKTTDGWANWTNEQAGSFRDIEFKPGDPNTMYACTTSSFYRSTDGGNNWVATNTGLPSGENRSAIAVSAANANYVYYLAGPGGASGGGTYNGTYRSTDSGLTFSQRSTTPNILGNSQTGSGTSDQSWYDLSFEVDPTNAEVVVVGGVNVWRSTNGGSSYTIEAHWVLNTPGLSYTHADIHNLTANLLDNVIYCASDGGISKSTDGGATFTNIWDGLEIMQFYRIAGIETNQNLIIGGTQDNGTNKYTGTPNIEHIQGGDGMDCMIDPTNSNTMYYSFQNGVLRRSTNGGNTATTIQPGGSTGAWVTPFGMDQNNPNVIYGGYNDVYRSTNQGNTWTNLGSDGRGALAVGINDPARLYASNGATIQTSANTGGSWTTITAGLPGLIITFIAVDPLDADRVWITLGGYTAGQKVYESTDAGATWTNISGALPNMPIWCIAYQNTGGAPMDALYVGGAVGVYYKDDANPWMLHNTGLPNVPVRDLEINHTNSKIRAGTYGRGLWETDLFSMVAPCSITATATAVDETCAGAMDGSITVMANAVGCAGALEYSLNGGAFQASNVFMGLGGGAYTIVVRCSTDPNCTTTVTATVNAGQNIPPTIMCPGDQNLACGANIPAAATTEAELNAQGGSVTYTCGPITITSMDTQTGDACTGITVSREYTVTDAANQTATCTQTITVAPPNDPTITCPADMTVTCEADIVVDAANTTVTTDCGLGFATWVDQPHITGARDCDGTTYEYTYHVVDDCGNGATCIQTFTLQNNPPTITVIPGITVECAADIETDPSDATVTTSCGEVLDVTIYAPVINGTPDCDGTTYDYTYRVEDQCEREATAVRTFTIQNAAPAVTAPDDTTCECFAALNTNGANASVDVACDLGYDVAVSVGPGSSTQDCPNTFYDLTYTAEDDCGRTASGVQRVTLQNGPPVFVNAPSVPLQINCEDEGWEDIIQAWLASVQAKNSCGLGLSVSNNYNPNNQGLCINNGTVVVTFFATDQCFRTSTETGMIIIADTEPPVFAEEAQDELDICNYNTPYDFDAWVDAHGGAIAYDGCDDFIAPFQWSTIPNNPTFPNCMGQMGPVSVTVTFVVRDDCGNKASSTATYTALMSGGDLGENTPGGDIADFLTLYPNRPNPFRTETTVSFNLPELGNVELTIFDLNGKALYRVKDTYEAGFNEILVNRSLFDGSGLMYYQLSSDTETVFDRMILMD